MIGEHFIWSEKYRPTTLDQVILPESLKAPFRQEVADGFIQDAIFTGSPGIGKTTLAKAVLDDINADWMLIHASLHGNIDTLRTDIQNFASTVSFKGGRKYVILDEADHLNPQSTQPALRNFMDGYTSNCGFIMTCNMPERIIPALKSRAPVYNFKITKKELPEILKQIMARVIFILESENVPYDKSAVAEVIKKHYPDWRKVINQLQRYSKATGRIDAGILVNTNEELIKELMGYLKNRKWDDMRKWVGINSDIDAHEVIRAVFDGMHRYMKPTSLPQVVVTLGKYQDQLSSVPDQEIQLVACLTELMVEAEFI